MQQTTSTDAPSRKRERRPLESYIDKSDPSGCWLWLGEINSKGYGRYRVGRVRYQAHRWVYMLLVGEIPNGMPLDHLCRVRPCVNPEHLEPVTVAENNARAWEIRGRNTCLHGHEFTEANTYRQPARPNVRRCRKCRSEQRSATNN